MRLLKSLALVGTLLIGACASNDFVSSWQSEDATTLNVAESKVAAIVMMKSEGSRRKAEDLLAQELSNRGAEGIPLYKLMPETGAVNESAIRATLEEMGIAGAVVMRPIGTETKVVSTPSSGYYNHPRYNRFYGGYYNYGWNSPWDRGIEVRTNTIVHVETLVYSLVQNKLVWGGQSKSTNPSNVDQLIKDTARKVANELARLGLIAK
jgi:hypothetical protein